MQNPLNIAGCVFWVCLLITGCGSSVEHVFRECKHGIDENRLIVRQTGHYSYSYTTYRECMRPVELKMD